jgi:DegV family protein with EDD domain
MAQKNESLEKITAKINTLIPKTNASFVIDTLDYLYMGGRCSSMEHVVGSLLKIRPVIEVKKDGTLGVKEKVSGSRKKALNLMLENFVKNMETIDPTRVFVTHSACPHDAEYLCEELEKV